jgi:hypothetical protein
MSQQPERSHDAPVTPLTLRQRLWAFTILARLRELSSTRFKRCHIHYMNSVRHSNRRLPRKQGEVVGSCCQHRFVALRFRSQVGPGHIALFYRRNHIANVPEMGASR